MRQEFEAIEAIELLKKAYSALDKTYLSNYRKNRLKDLIIEIENELDLRD